MSKRTSCFIRKEADTKSRKLLRIANRLFVVVVVVAVVVS